MEILSVEAGMEELSYLNDSIEYHCADNVYNIVMKKQLLASKYHDLDSAPSLSRLEGEFEKLRKVSRSKCSGFVQRIAPSPEGNG